MTSLSIESTRSGQSSPMQGYFLQLLCVPLDTVVVWYKSALLDNTTHPWGGPSSCIYHNEIYIAGVFPRQRTKVIEGIHKWRSGAATKVHHQMASGLAKSRKSHSVTWPGLVTWGALKLGTFSFMPRMQVVAARRRKSLAETISRPPLLCR